MREKPPDSWASSRSSDKDKYHLRGTLCSKPGLFWATVGCSSPSLGCLGAGLLKHLRICWFCSRLHQMCWSLVRSTVFNSRAFQGKPLGCFKAILGALGASACRQGPSPSDHSSPSPSLKVTQVDCFAQRAH
jgi:hypothetical protein